MLDHSTGGEHAVSDQLYIGLQLPFLNEESVAAARDGVRGRHRRGCLSDSHEPGPEPASRAVRKGPSNGLDTPRPTTRRIDGSTDRRIDGSTAACCLREGQHRNKCQEVWSAHKAWSARRTPPRHGPPCFWSHDHAAARRELDFAGADSAGEPVNRVEVADQTGEIADEGT